MARAHVVIDYQNIHLTGHGLFRESEPPHLCLTHPLHFANQVISQRNLIKRLTAERDGAPHEDAELASVHVFRGQPSNKNNPTGYRRTQAQQSEWTRDPRVNVRYRTLKYYQDGSIKEKGIDVLVALTTLTLAAGEDIVILAAHDTDQEPALEMSSRIAPGRVETAGWRGARVLRVRGETFWHTALDEQAFERTVDRRDYT